GACYALDVDHGAVAIRSQPDKVISEVLLAHISELAAREFSQFSTASSAVRHLATTSGNSAPRECVDAIGARVLCGMVGASGAERLAMSPQWEPAFSLMNLQTVWLRWSVRAMIA